MSRTFRIIMSLSLASVSLAGCAASPTVAANAGNTATPAASVTANPFDLTKRQWDATGSYVCGAGAISADPDDPDRYLGYEIPTSLVDGGAQPGAMGTATYDEDGQPVAYTVAEGDDFTSLEMRFCTPGLYLQFVNSIRRGTTDLYVGDTINLSAYKMTTVGDVNGVVHEGSPAFGADYVPPQQ